MSTYPSSIAVFDLPVVHTCGLLAMHLLLRTVKHSVFSEWIASEFSVTGVSVIAVYRETARSPCLSGFYFCLLTGFADPLAEQF